MAMDILSKFYPGKEFPAPAFCNGRTPEYWAGWAISMVLGQTLQGYFRALFKQYH